MLTGNARRGGRLALTRRSSTPRVLVAHPSSELYGSDRVMLESVRAMVAAGWEVAVALPGLGPLAPEIRRRGARVITCPSPVLRKSALRPVGMLRLLAETLRGVWTGARLLLTWRPDALYVSTLTMPLWLILANLTGVRAVCHVHEAEGSASRVIRALLALPLFLAGHVIANSRYSRVVITSGFSNLGARTQVVYNGVAGPPEVTAPRQHIEGRLRILYVGRLSERKGADVAIDALALLVANGRNVEMDLVGAVFPGYEWYERQLREQVARQGLGDRVRFLGFEPNVWDRLTAADICLVPSRLDEPFGNTAVESFLAARPLVVSDTSGLREATAGFRSRVRVEPGSARAVADAVEEIASDWVTHRGWALADSAAARLRFAPNDYRAQVLLTMTELMNGRTTRDQSTAHRRIEERRVGDLRVDDRRIGDRRLGNEPLDHERVGDRRVGDRRVGDRRVDGACVDRPSVEGASVEVASSGRLIMNWSRSKRLRSTLLAR